VDPAAADCRAIRMASRSGHLPVVIRLLQCREVLRTVRPLLVARALVVEAEQLRALLCRDALLRRGHLAAAAFRRRRIGR